MDSNNMNNNYQDNTSSYQAQPTYTAPQEPSNGGKGLAIASLILGIASIVLCCCTYITVILGVAAIVCAIISKKQGGSGMATAGLVCGIIGVIIGGGLWIASVALTNAIGSTDPEVIQQWMMQYMGQ